MGRARKGWNREHVFEPSTTWDKLHIPSLVRHHPAHIIHMPIATHNRMNSELTQMATMSDRLGRMVLDWIDDQPLLDPEERWQTIEREAEYLESLRNVRTSRMLGAEALYFSRCLEVKLQYYKGEK